MLFNSFEFALFLPIVFLLYWFVFRGLRLQNLFVVAVSYLFYGWWDWRFLILIALTTAASYWSGLLIEKHRQSRAAKVIAASNIVLNLAILCVFKYFNFFSENLGKLFELFGVGLDWVTLDILLPVGISFYTFQALSYTIDVYKRKLEPTHDVVSFFAYVSFFPQLVAGPIERATNLLPQFYVKRTFNYNYATEGLRQILWGLFKKIVVADSCAVYANEIFDNFERLDGSVLLIGAIAFAFQIYGDFSGYSDIAIGTAKLFGIRLMRNFNMPYFSRDIAEFWRRWHISLTTWFRDYIYIPLGGSRGGKWISVRNTFIIFLVSGFWHGANWTFIAWGAYHAVLFLPLLILGKNRKYTDTVAAGRWLPSVKEILQMLATFVLATVGWIIFRAQSIEQAYQYFIKIFDFNIKSVYSTYLSVDRYPIEILLLIALFVVIEWIWRADDTPISKGKYVNLRAAITLVLLLVLGSFASYESFIYFAF